MIKQVQATLRAGESGFFLEDAPVLTVAYDGGAVSVKAFYDFRDAPLCLRAPAAPGDEVSLLIRPCRLELYVNGGLADEEWPVGSIALGGACRAQGSFPLLLTELEAPEETGRPSTLRSGRALNELLLPGVNIGDCMPFSADADGMSAHRADGRYHLFYLYDRHHHRSKWGLGAHQWAHVSTADFATWDAHPNAVEITEDWEGSICTGSVVYDGQAYYAWYAVRMADGSPARMTAALSTDLYHFKKTSVYFTLPDAYEPASARDPKVVFVEGRYHMFVTTSLQESGLGCLAHLVSDRMSLKSEDWKDLGPILTGQDEQQPECPDYFRMGGYYYLVYSIRGTARYVYSRTPFGEGGWIQPQNGVIPCGRVPKSAVLNGERIFAGFLAVCGYAGPAVFSRARQNPDGTLSFDSFPVG